MAYTLIWSTTARQDFRDLITYISESNSQVATDFGLSVFKIIERLKEFPESGRIVPELNDPSIREIIRKPCRIVYRVRRNEELIEIARIWHAARGIPEI